jgi:hypothetical protein
MRWTLKMAGIDCSSINATNNQGRMSTIHASLDMDEEEKTLFFKHMGHSSQINENTYQKPLPVMAIEKVGVALQRIDEESGLIARTS